MSGNLSFSFRTSNQESKYILTNQTTALSMNKRDILHRNCYCKNNPDYIALVWTDDNLIKIRSHTSSPLLICRDLGDLRKPMFNYVQGLFNMKNTCKVNLYNIIETHT